MFEIKDARAAYTMGVRGNFGKAVELRRILMDDQDPKARAWDLALMAQRWTAEPTAAPAPSTQAMSELAAIGGEVSEPLALICRELAQVSVLRGDWTGLDGWVAFLRSLPNLSESGHANLLAAELWSTLGRGELSNLDSQAATLLAEASRLGLATLVIEATTLRAWAALSAGDDEEATVFARRASRMGRTEAIPFQEYQANWVLARLRRRGGRPHLAARILIALLRVAPSHWSGRLRWELTMAGAIEEAFPSGLPDFDESSPSTWSALICLARTVSSAESGVDFGLWKERLLTSVSGLPLVAPETEALLQGLDVHRPLTATIEPWAKGLENPLPPALTGVCTRFGAAPKTETASAHVLADPAGPGRRLVRAGTSLIQDTRVFAQTRRKQGRVETLVSVLALAGPLGCPEDSCFEEVYGFPFQPEVHRGSFDVMIHRARDYLDGSATIERGSGRVTMAVHQPFLIPDPRCSQPVEDRLLRVLAVRPGAAAKDLAQELGVSLRTAQGALQELSKDGACIADREGRKVRYRVEDTTFSEPTSHGDPT